MYKLVTLRRVYENYKPDGFDPEFPIGEIRTRHKPEYSNELRSLIQHCLKERPEDRPTIDVISEIIDDMTYDRPYDESSDYLYYRGDEIESMAPGRYLPEVHEKRLDSWCSIEDDIRAHSEQALHFPRFPNELPTSSSGLERLERTQRRRVRSFNRPGKEYEERDNPQFFVRTPSPGGGPGHSSPPDDGDDDVPKDPSGNDDGGGPRARTSSNRKRPLEDIATSRPRKRHSTKLSRTARSGHPDISSPPVPGNAPTAPAAPDTSDGDPYGLYGVGFRAGNDSLPPEKRMEDDTEKNTAEFGTPQAPQRRQGEPEPSRRRGEGSGNNEDDSSRLTGRAPRNSTEELSSVLEDGEVVEEEA